MSLPELPEIKQLSPYVTRLLGANPGPFTLQGTNTYLIGDPKTRERVLLDTGDAKHEYYQLLKGFVESNDLIVTTVMITHSHHDHILGVPDVHKLFPLAKFLKYTMAPSFEYDEIDKSMFTHWGDCEVIEAAGLHFVAYYTPGHCDDHLCIWLEEEGALFSGDNLLGHGSTVFNHYGNYMQSLIRMRDLPHLSVVYPGHGDIIEDGVLAFNMYLEHRRQREYEILKILQATTGELTTDEIVSRIYDAIESRPDRIRRAAANNTKQYLEKLRGDKKVAGDGDIWRCEPSNRL